MAGYVWFNQYRSTAMILTQAFSAIIALCVHCDVMRFIDTGTGRAFSKIIKCIF